MKSVRSRLFTTVADCYDSIGRLASHTSGVTVTYEYDVRSNITSFPPGDYSRSYDTDGRLTSDGTRGITSISYLPWQNLPYLYSLSNGNKAIINYMSDGSLRSRVYQTSKLYTVTKVNPETKEKETVKQLRTYAEYHTYLGDFERIDNQWRLHTPAGYYDLNNNELCYYIKDRLGSVVAVVDSAGRTCQLTCYYPSGIPYDLFGFSKTTDKLHIGNRWLALGLNTYDNTARYHYPLIPSYDTPDPRQENYPDLSPYAHCAGNPMKYIDKTGKDCLVIIDGNEITITANIIIYGKFATDELAKLYQDGIDNSWGKINSYTDSSGEKYSLSWNVNVVNADNKIMHKHIYNGINNYFEVFNIINSKGKNTSYVKGSNHGEIRVNGNLEKTLENSNPMPHEFGHLLGLKDKYNKKGPIDIFWEGNIMAEKAGEGIVEYSNINQLLEPSIFLNKYLGPIIKSVNPNYIFRNTINKNFREK